MENGSVAVTALLSGSLKFVVAGLGDLIAAKARGMNVAVISSTYNGYNGYILLSKTVADKLGVSLNAPVSERMKALDGLVIGSASPTSIATTVPKNATEAVGAKLRFAYMAQPAFAAALSTGAIQGASLGAPYWLRPITQGTGVLWINGPKGEFPADSAPSISAVISTMRDYAAANPELIRKLASVFDDLGKAVDEQPATVKAAIAKSYPELDSESVDLLFETEAPAWRSKPLTAAIMAREIGQVKQNGANVPGIEALDPASLLLN